MKRINIVWYLKQLLPLMYVTTYREGGVKHLTIWRMWFGRSFAVSDYRVYDDNDTDVDA